MAVLKIARRSMIIYFTKGKIHGAIRRYGVITYTNRKQNYLVLSYNEKYESKIIKFLEQQKDSTSYELSLFNYSDFDMNLDIKAVD